MSYEVIVDVTWDTKSGERPPMDVQFLVVFPFVGIGNKPQEFVEVDVVAFFTGGLGGMVSVFGDHHSPVS